MDQIKTESDSDISVIGREVAASELGCLVDDVDVVSVSGGYSRNRRSLVGYKDRWIFVKEVDTGLLSSDGSEELGWLKKDYECTNILRGVVPDIIPDWGKLKSEDHVLVMSSYRVEDGWSWSVPAGMNDQQKYVQAVVDATKKLEPIKFSEEDVNKLKLHSYFRDELALSNDLGFIIQNDEIRNQLIAKYNSMLNDESLTDLYSSIHQIQKLLHDKNMLRNLSIQAASLMNQPNDCFGHCDVRSDNIAYNSLTSQVKFVDWNWASYVTKSFGSTEFLVDMSRRGVDVSQWSGELNSELLAALVGYFLRQCIADPLAPGNTLRDVQAQSAAVAYNLYSAIQNV